MERLGKCEVCNVNSARYSCPKCEVKTCRIECVRIHKKELECDGIKNKTKYIPLKQITAAELEEDYLFLEACNTIARRTDKIKFSKNKLTVPLMKLKKAAVERQIKLKFLLPNFNKHKSNTTYYDWASKVIYWCIEWRFINAHNKIIIDERCCESKLMTELIGKYFDYGNSISSLACYRSKGINNIVLLLKAEGVRKNHNRYFRMDASKTLQENLRGKTIVEHPVIYLIFDSEIHTYDVINSNNSILAEETRKHIEHYFPTITKKRLQHHSSKKDGDEAPVNFLFSNANETITDIDDDDDDEDYDDGKM